MEGKEDPAKKHAAVEAIGPSRKTEQRPDAPNPSEKGDAESVGEKSTTDAGPGEVVAEKDAAAPVDRTQHLDAGERGHELGGGDKSTPEQHRGEVGNRPEAIADPGGGAGEAGCGCTTQTPSRHFWAWGAGAVVLGACTSAAKGFTALQRKFI